MGLSERLKKIKAKAAAAQRERERKLREVPADQIVYMGKMSPREANWLAGGVYGLTEAELDEFEQRLPGDHSPEWVEYYKEEIAAARARFAAGLPNVPPGWDDEDDW